MSDPRFEGCIYPEDYDQVLAAPAQFQDVRSLQNSLESNLLGCEQRVTLLIEEEARKNAARLASLEHELRWMGGAIAVLLVLELWHRL